MKKTSVFLVFCLLAACAAGGGQRLTLDSRQVPAVDYLPDEVTAMMESLGYEVVPESDTEKLAQSFDNYKLQFRARDDANVRVDVHFKLTAKITLMHLYDLQEKTPSAVTQSRFDMLKKRAQQEFGVESVE